MKVFDLIDGKLYQWDTGRRIKITPPHGTSINKIHYHDGQVVSVSDDMTARIPPTLLQTAKNITIYGVFVRDDGTRTKCDWTFAVKPKPKPNDYEYVDVHDLTDTVDNIRAIIGA